MENKQAIKNIRLQFLRALKTGESVEDDRLWTILCENVRQNLDVSRPNISRLSVDMASHVLAHTEAPEDNAGHESYHGIAYDMLSVVADIGHGEAVSDPLFKKLLKLSMPPYTYKRVPGELIFSDKGGAARGVVVALSSKDFRRASKAMTCAYRRMDGLFADLYAKKGAVSLAADIGELVPELVGRNVLLRAMNLHKEAEAACQRGKERGCLRSDKWAHFDLLHIGVSGALETLQKTYQDCEARRRDARLARLAAQLRAAGCSSSSLDR